MTSKKFEQRFEGKDNAGLRQQIRDAVRGCAYGFESARAVMVLEDTVALTASGRHTLALVAEDYRNGGR